MWEASAGPVMERRHLLGIGDAHLGHCSTFSFWNSVSLKQNGKVILNPCISSVCWTQPLWKQYDIFNLKCRHLRSMVHSPWSALRAGRLGALKVKIELLWAILIKTDYFIFLWSSYKKHGFFFSFPHDFWRSDFWLCFLFNSLVWGVFLKESSDLQHLKLFKRKSPAKF